MFDIYIFFPKETKSSIRLQSPFLPDLEDGVYLEGRKKVYVKDRDFFFSENKLVGVNIFTKDKRT